MENKPINEYTGEELAILLQEQYQRINQCHQAIAVINNELQSRMKEKTEVVSG